MSERNGSERFFYVTAFFAFFILLGFVYWIFWTGWSTGVSRYKQESQSAEYALHAQQEIEQRCLLLEPVIKSKCIRDVIETTNEHDRAERDIVAQHEMAWWAAWMAIISGFTAFVSLVGIYYIRQTLMETRRIGQSEIRAYLSVSAEVIPASRGSDLGDQQEFEIVIRNNGLSPARNLRFIANAAWKPRTLESPCPDLVGPKKVSLTPMFTISAGDLVKGSVRSHLIHRDFIPKDTNDGERVPMIFGIIWYEDVFGNHRQKRFAFMAEAAINTNTVPSADRTVAVSITLFGANAHNDEN